MEIYSDKKRKQNYKVSVFDKKNMLSTKSSLTVNKYISTDYKLIQTSLVQNRIKQSLNTLYFIYVSMSLNG